MPQKKKKKKAAKPLVKPAGKTPWAQRRVELLHLISEFERVGVNPLLTYEFAAAALDVKPATVRYWASINKLPFPVRKKGKYVRIKLSDINNALAALDPPELAAV